MRLQTDLDILVRGLDSLEVLGWDGLRLIIGEVAVALVPKHIEVPLRDLVPNPVVGDVDRARSFLFDGASGDALGDRVVSDGDGSCLGVSEGHQSVAQGNGTLRGSE